MGSIICKPVSIRVGFIKMEGMEIENIVRAFENTQKVSASQEELCSNVLRRAAYQNGITASR
jgi:hypothetical protein